MGLLDQLWDDTVAGPRPEFGLGKLRKQQSLSFGSNSSKGLNGGNATTAEEATKVTRSIMIVKPPGYGSQSSDSPLASPAASPAGSTPPVSPFSGGGKESFRFRRRSTSDTYDKASEGMRAKISRSPYDV